MANVSPTTASLILNERGSFPEATRARVRKVAGELEYSPNMRARKLRSAKSEAIALITALPPGMLRNRERLAYYRELALPAAAEAMDRGYTLTLLPPLEDGSAIKRLDVDGAIVVDPPPDSDLMAQLNHRHIPVVTIGALAGINAVAMIDRGIWGVDQVVDHFTQSGLAHLLLVDVDTRTPLTESTTRYLRARSQHDGFTLTEVRVSSAGEPEELQQVLTHQLARPDPPDAIYTPWSFLAATLMSMATSSGIRVPQELAFATNFNSPHVRGSTPAITTMELHLDQLATMAVDVLIRHLAGEPVPSTIPSPAPKLVVRGSSQRTAGVSEFRCF